jgi:biotin operon repressor
MTLIEALDAARFIDLTLPVGAPVMLRLLVAWQREEPDAVRELYAVAGMPSSLDPVTPRDSGSVVMPTGSLGHRDAAPVRIYHVLSDSDFHALDDLAHELRVTPACVWTAIGRLRTHRHLDIRSMKRFGRRGFQLFARRQAA